MFVFAGPIFLASDGISLSELKKCSKDEFTVGKILAGVLRAMSAASVSIHSKNLIFGSI